MDLGSNKTILHDAEQTCGTSCQTHPGVHGRKQKRCTNREESRRARRRATCLSSSRRVRVIATTTRSVRSPRFADRFYNSPHLPLHGTQQSLLLVSSKLLHWIEFLRDSEFQVPLICKFIDGLQFRLHGWWWLDHSPPQNSTDSGRNVPFIAKEIALPFQPQRAAAHPWSSKGGDLIMSHTSCSPTTKLGKK
jgi:hypothetical protein